VLAAAVVPHPPVLVPQIAAGAAGELAPLLRACDAAVSAAVATGPRSVVCVGGGGSTARYPATAWGTLAGYGGPVDPPARREGRPSLPLSLTLGRWLLDRAGWDGPTALQEITFAAPPRDCADLGHRLAADGAGGDVAWLVLGDGTTGRWARGPRPLDPRAAPFDEGVARALAGGNTQALSGLDAALAAELGAGGRAAWQVLAAAAESGVRQAELRYEGAPFGVGYLVASWWL
jgi:hypothetical protein